MQLSTNSRTDSLGDLRSLIGSDAAELSKRLRARQIRDFPAAGEKTIRSFSPAEAARFIHRHPRGVSSADHFGWKWAAALGQWPTNPSQPSSRPRLGRNEHPPICPRRRDSERLQVVSVMNFKGGGKTTTSASEAVPCPQRLFVSWRSIRIRRPVSLRSSAPARTRRRRERNHLELAQPKSLNLELLAARANSWERTK